MEWFANTVCDVKRRVEEWKRHHDLAQRVMDLEWVARLCEFFYREILPRADQALALVPDVPIEDQIRRQEAVQNTIEECVAQIADLIDVLVSAAREVDAPGYRDAYLTDEKLSELVRIKQGLRWITDPEAFPPTRAEVERAVDAARRGDVLEGGW